MGKYNFDYGRLNELEKRLSILEVKNKQLESENNKLKAAIQGKSTHSIDRNLVSAIDEEVYNELFGVDVDPKSGELIKADNCRRNTNFTNFYRYLVTFFKPVAKCNNGQQNRFLLKYPNLYELSIEEYRICAKMVHDVAEIVYSAKRARLEKMEEA